MADQLYLSYWLDTKHPLKLMRQFERLLGAFPYSKLARHDPSLRVYAIAFNEPPLIETPLPSPIDVLATLKICSEFQNLDTCYELTAAWDLWHHDRDWSLAPAAVRLTAFAPEFDNEIGDHLRIDLGIEDQFLPDADAPEGLAMVRANMQSLLRLVHDLDERLGAARRSLWTESGVNFAERVERVLVRTNPSG